MNAEKIIAILALLVIASYVFGVLSRWTKIPSVILLLATGMAVRLLFHELPVKPNQLQMLVQLLGVAGLVMIVLEAALDLSVSRDNVRLILNAFLSAVFILLASTAAITTLLHYWFNTGWRTSVIFAIPLSIISSAIVIPSTQHLPGTKKEFVVYESAFSDIVGILLFNYLTLTDAISAESVFGAGASLVLSLVGSLAVSVALLWLTERTTTPVKFFLLLSVLFLLYVGGKLAHLPSLVVVLAFGLILNNLDLLLHPMSEKYFDHEKLRPVVDQFKWFTLEISFFVRTFFFLLFGFSLDLWTLADPQVLAVGCIVVLLLLTIRFLYLRFMLKTNLFPEIFLMPRGLITVLLFYSIPERFLLPAFDPGIVFFVIVASTILMSGGLLFFKVSPESIIE